MSNVNIAAKLAIELDTVLYGPFTAWQAEMAEQNVEATMVNEHGPGGGHPIIRYVGTREALAIVLRRYFSADSDSGESIEFMLSEATPVES